MHHVFYSVVFVPVLFFFISSLSLASIFVRWLFFVSSLVFCCALSGFLCFAFVFIFIIVLFDFIKCAYGWCLVWVQVRGACMLLQCLSFSCLHLLAQFFSFLSFSRSFLIPGPSLTHSCFFAFLLNPALSCLPSLLLFFIRSVQLLILALIKLQLHPIHLQQRNV